MSKRTKAFWRCKYCNYKNWSGNRACVQCSRNQKSGLVTRGKTIYTPIDADKEVQR